jgi:hypothetical protein
MSAMIPLESRPIAELSDDELAELKRLTRIGAASQARIRKLVIDGLLPSNALPEGARPCGREVSR